MAIALVQSVGGDQLVNSQIVTIAASGAGNLIAVLVWAYSGTSNFVASITDNAGNTYVQVPGAFSINTDTLIPWSDIWYAKNILPGATTVTINYAPARNGAVFQVIEYSGVDPVTPVDVAGHLDNQNSTLHPLSPSLTITNGADALLAICSNNSTNNFNPISVASPWSAVPNNFGGFVFVATDLAPGSPGSYQATYTAGGSGDYCSSGVAFQPVFSHVTSTYSASIGFNNPGTNANTTTGNGNSNFSVAFWTNNPTDGNNIISKANISSPPFQGWSIFRDFSNIFFQVTYVDSSVETVQSTGTVPDDNLWHHIAVTYDSSSGLVAKIYIDGVLDTTFTHTLTSTNYDNSVALTMGESGGFATSAYFDDMRFYQTTLTSTDVSQLAMGFEISAASRQAYWSIEEGSGNIFNDVTGNGNTITFVSNPTWSIDVPPQLGDTVLTLNLSDSISSVDAMTDSFSIPLSDSVSSSDAAPQAFSVQSNFITPVPVPAVETLVNQLVPAATKTYFRIEE